MGWCRALPFGTFREVSWNASACCSIHRCSCYLAYKVGTARHRSHGICFPHRTWHLPPKHMSKRLLHTCQRMDLEFSTYKRLPHPCGRVCIAHHRNPCISHPRRPGCLQCRKSCKSVGAPPNASADRSMTRSWSKEAAKATRQLSQGFFKYFFTQTSSH